MNILYGIKNCDTVKKARAWLETNHIEYKFHDFRTDGLSEIQVRNWINEIGLEALVNKRSTTWKEMDEQTKNKFNENAVQIITANPTLIKRPLLETGKQRYVGFEEAEYARIF